nr:hypothetical protein [Phenylobacterium zucineum]
MKTYALYLRAADENTSRVEAVTCKTNVEAMQRARALLAQNPQYEAVDVSCGDGELFRVKRDRKPPPG